MDRLTKRHGKHAVQIGGETRRHDEAWLKLAQYEDLEEAGRLIELPCKVGEEVWTVHKEWGIQHATYHRADRILLDIENGHVFVKTKEEAQAKWKEFKRGKLAEMKGGEAWVRI